MKIRVQLGEVGEDLFVVGQEGCFLLLAGPEKEGSSATAVYSFDMQHEKLSLLYVHQGFCPPTEEVPPPFFLLLFFFCFFQARERWSVRALRVLSLERWHCWL